MSEDKANEIVRTGFGAVRSLCRSTTRTPAGIVDLFAIGVRNFSRDTVATTLKQRGAEPSDNLDAGFHILDPEGISVQIVGG